MENNNQLDNDNKEEITKAKEKLPLDARLLSDAVIEFNISRRSVSLYPPGHAMILKSIDRAFALLEKLFELRTSITLGIAQDTLIIDDNILDKKNAVLTECALSFHERGIAGVTFHAGLDKDELTKLHELMTQKDGLTGKALIEAAKQGGVRHIVMSPVDYDSFRFVEGATAHAASDEIIWEDYIYGLMTGKLTTDDKNYLFDLPPEDVAEAVNSAPDDAQNKESYDRVITSYLRSKKESKLSPEAMEKLTAIVGNLKPGIKQQFLSRTFKNLSIDIIEVESMLTEMTADGFEQIVKMFNEHNSLVPETLKNVIDKLSSIKSDGSFGFDMMYKDSAIVHDIELNDDFMNLFDEDHFSTFVSEQYQHDLNKMLDAKKQIRRVVPLKELITEGTNEVIDKVVSETMLEVLEADITTRDDYLNILSRLAELSKEFVETGRFEETLNVYNTIYSHTLEGKYPHEAASTLQYFFRSDAFLDSFVDSALLWGRSNREGVTRLAKVLKSHAINRLIDTLMQEQNASLRKFLITLLTDLGSDVLPEAVKRLRDNRWFVLRNMIYLIRECGVKKYVAYVKRYAKHEDSRVSLEAIKTLLHFNTPEAVPHLKVFLKSENSDIRDQALKLVSTYRVRDVVPHLVEQLMTKDRLGSQTENKIAIIETLGDVGDTRSIDPLIKIYTSRSLFSRQWPEKIKEEIFNNLYHYQPNAIKPLIELGRRSRNETIRAKCEDMVKNIILQLKNEGHSNV